MLTNFDFCIALGIAESTEVGTMVLADTLPSMREAFIIIH